LSAIQEGRHLASQSCFAHGPGRTSLFARAPHAARPSLRLVTHLDVSKDDVQKTIAAFRAFFK
jgi:threonine aldolase